VALEIAESRPATYLDLESEADRARLSEPELYLADHAGKGTGRFLLLGSASLELLAQSGETHDVEPSFYRTSGGAEVDLVLAWPDAREWAIEVKRTLAPKLERGLRSALADIEPERRFLVYPGDERYRLGEGVETLGLPELCEEIRAVARS
jgi:hypothetical protein